MSVLAVFAFSEASIAVRRRVLRWSAELLFPEAPVEVPSGKPTLLRDADIGREIGEGEFWERRRREAVYRSHWSL